MDKTQLNKAIGAKIYAIRKEKAITLKELGRLVGLTESTVMRYEKGEIKAVDIDAIKRFADALHVPANMLIGWDTGSPACTLFCTEEERALIQKFRHLPPSGRETVKAVVDVQYKAVAPAGSRKDTS